MPQTQAPAAPAASGIIAPGARRNGRRLGDVIVELGFAGRRAVEEAVERAHTEHRPTGEVLVEMGVMDTRQLARALAERNGLDYVDLNDFEVDKGAANLVSATEARRFGAIPIAFCDEKSILAATANPANVLGIDALGMLAGYDVRIAIAAPEEIEALISQLTRLSASVEEVHEDDGGGDEAEVISLRESAEQAPVVKLVHSIIADAVERGASDIHLEPRREDLRVRYRVDGVAFDTTTVPRRLAAGLISRIKVMAELDIAERRIPQDGRMPLNVDGRFVDIRVATLPVVRGEAVVLRILDKGTLPDDLASLGMDADDRGRVQRAVRSLHGAVLVTGPTGSGKTTTLYALLSELNTAERTLITIEDPVEYELEGVKQVQVNQKTKLSFAAGLRSMIRSDPDVLMVGEIRDGETAKISIESALTGHLVLSTLHTTEAPMAAPRLIEMGVEPFLVASALECVVAQRLARRLCESCRRPVEVSAKALERSGFPPGSEGFSGYEPGGCMRCGNTGFRGRIGLYEVMLLSDELKDLILRKAPSGEIASAAAANGMRRLHEDGLAKARTGITSVPEVLRVLGG